MEQAPHEKKILHLVAQAAKGRGGAGRKRQLPQVPKKMANPPGVKLGLGIFYDAFLDLVPGHETAIPWADLKSWADLAGLDAEATDDLVFYCRGLHLVLREHLRHKGKRPDNPRRTQEGKDDDAPRVLGRDGKDGRKGPPGRKLAKAAPRPAYRSNGSGRDPG